MPNQYNKFNDDEDNKKEVNYEDEYKVNLDSMQELLDQSQAHLEHPKLEMRRWLILIAFGTLTFTNASGFVAFSSILETVQEYFRINKDQAMWFSNVYYVIFIAGCIPTVFMWNWRFDINLYISSFLNMVGGLGRYFSGSNYTWSLISTIVIAIAQLWILAAPGIIAERWFGAEERILALSIAFFCNILGLSYGYLTSAYLVKGLGDMESYLLFCAINLSIPFFLCLIFIRNKPKNMPNISSSEESHKLGMVDSLKKCYFNWKNLLAICALSLYLGISWTFEACLEILLDYTVLEIGYIGLFMNLAGTVGGLITSVIIEKELQKGLIPKYDLFLKIFSSIAYFLVIAFTVLQIFDKKGEYKILVFIITTLIGLGFNAFAPIAISSMLETVFPVSEIVGMTIFNQTANIFGLAGGYVANIGMWVVCLLMTPLYLYLMIFYKTQLTRLKVERKVSIKRSMSHH